MDLLENTNFLPRCNKFWQAWILKLVEHILGPTYTKVYVLRLLSLNPISNKQIFYPTPILVAECWMATKWVEPFFLSLLKFEFVPWDQFTKGSSFGVHITTTYDQLANRSHERNSNFGKQEKGFLSPHIHSMSSYKQLSLRRCNKFETTLIIIRITGVNICPKNQNLSLDQSKLFPKKFH